MGYELTLNVATKFSLSSKIETFECKCISLPDVSIERTVLKVTFTGNLCVSRQNCLLGYMSLFSSFQQLLPKTTMKETARIPPSSKPDTSIFFFRYQVSD